MPVQIDEVVITTTVNPQAAAQSVSASPGPDQLELEQETRDRILQIIRENSER